MTTSEKRISEIPAVNVSIEIPAQRIIDLFVGAIEGGSNYWYLIDRNDYADLKLEKKFAFSETIPYACLSNPDFKVPVRDLETNKVLGEVTREKIATGLYLMAKDHPRHFSDLIGGTDDASTADVFFQLVVMGKVVFG